jgi:glutamate racemase
MLGVFDSGLGGLTVLKEIKKKLGNEKIIYFGDTARVPWGDKSPATVCKYAEEVADFLISRGAKKIVIACNTASALAYDHLCKKFPTICFYDVISPAVRKIEKEASLFFLKSPQKKYRLGIIGTNGTIKSRAYPKEIKIACPRVTAFSVACPLFVPIVEEGLFKNKISLDAAIKYLTPLKKKKINALVLGCTHYPLLKPIIKKVLGKNVSLLEGSMALAEELSIQNPDHSHKKETPEDEYWFSDWSSNSPKLVQAILGKKIKVQIKLLGKIE